MFVAGPHRFTRGRAATNAAAYYTKYSQTLHNYAASGFFARDLDADDFAFIEGIRERGSVMCGSLADPTPTQCTYSDDAPGPVVLVEELDFWSHHCAAKAMRVGPLPRVKPTPVGSTPHAIERQRKREELAAAHAELGDHEERQRIAQLRRDLEWEKAAPPKRKFGDVNGRHYVPQWRLDEIRRLDRKIRAAEKAFERNRHRKRELERMVKAAQQPPTQAVATDPYRAMFKRRILASIQHAHPDVPTVNRLMAMTGCLDEMLFLSLLNELVREGHIKVHRHDEQLREQ